MSIDHTTPPAELSPDALINLLTDEEIQSMAALYDAPYGVPEITLASMPRAFRAWAESYGLAQFTSGDLGEATEVKITALGWAVIEAAYKRFPEPLKDLDVKDLTSEAIDAITRLPEPTVGIQLPKKFLRSHSEQQLKQAAAATSERAPRR